MNPSMNITVLARGVLLSKTNLQLYQDVKAAVLHPCTSSIMVCSSEFGGSTQQSTDLTHVSCASFMSADQRRELLEVVNEINEVVGLEARSVIHSKGLRHRAVYCLVFDSKRRLLLQQRSPRWLVDHECQQLSCDICHSMLARHSFNKRFLLQKTDWTWSVGSQCS